MIDHSIDLTIQRPPAEVFAWLTDEKHQSEWDATSIEMVPDPPGPWHTGLRFHEVRKMGGRNTPVESRIATFEKDKRFEIESLTGPEWHGTWLFSPTDSGAATRLQFRGQLTFKGFMRLMEPMIGGQFKKQLDKNFAKLKLILEGTSHAL